MKEFDQNKKSSKKQGFVIKLLFEILNCRKKKIRMINLKIKMYILFYFF